MARSVLFDFSTPDQLGKIAEHTGVANVRRCEPVVAYSKHNFGIGVNNDLPWHLPADMKRFKTITKGAAVLMGRKTAESIPFALPGRMNLVLTRSGKTPYEGQIPVTSVLEALQKAAEWDGAQKDILYVIGGQDVYEKAMRYYTGAHLTEVHRKVENPCAYFDVIEFYIAHPAEEFDRVAQEVVDDNGIATRYRHLVKRLPTPVDTTPLGLLNQGEVHER